MTIEDRTGGARRPATLQGRRARARRKAQKAGVRWPGLLSVALVPALILIALRAWLVEPVVVSSDSMEPAVSAGAVVLLYKPAVASGLVRNGAVVAFTSPADGGRAIKRVVAGAGQTVAIRDGELYVDDVAVAEPFIDRSRIDATYFGPHEVPAGSVFVLGDNRGVSIDSRNFGAIPLDAIQGAVLAGQG